MQLSLGLGDNCKDFFFAFFKVITVGNVITFVCYFGLIEIYWWVFSLVFPKIERFIRSYHSEHWEESLYPIIYEKEL